MQLEGAETEGLELLEEALHSLSKALFGVRVTAGVQSTVAP